MPDEDMPPGGMMTAAAPGPPPSVYEGGSQLDVAKHQAGRGFTAYDDMLRQRANQHASPSGSVTTGFVRCPLCALPAKSQKRFALGRGLRMHFASVHADVDPAPWLDAAEAAAAAGAVERSRGANSNHDGSRAPLPAGLVAARDGDLATLQALQASGGWWLDQTDHHGSSAVHWAAGGGHLDIVKWLIESVDPASATRPVSKRKRRDGRQPIHWAARNGCMDVLEYLLGNQEHVVEAPTFDGTTPLHLACFGGSVAAARRLLQAGARVDTENDWGCNSTHWAAMGGSVGILELLAAHRAPFQVLQKEGHSPLHKAAQRGHGDAIGWLLGEPYRDGGARELVSKPDTSGFRPSEIAEVAGHQDSAALLKAAGC